MAGHSHSSSIGFRKDRVDAKRAKAFARLSRRITVAARQGGGSLDGNAKLRPWVDEARVLGMPKDGIDRAIEKGAGAGDLGDVPLRLEILTDNRHRTAADVRIVMEKSGGNLGTSGAMAWMFERRGRFVVENGRSTIACRHAAFADVQEALVARGVPLRAADLAHVPTQRTPVEDAANATRLVKLIDALEDNDDVQSVFSNEAFPESVVRTLESS